MGLVRLLKFSLVLSLVCSLAWNAIAFNIGLTHQPIILGFYEPAETAVAKISPDGKLFGQIDKKGNAAIWAFANPAYPMLVLQSEPSRGHHFIDLNFSTDGSYIIFDSTLTNKGLRTKGQIQVVSTLSFLVQKFNTYILDGISRSRYTLSDNALLAYVPDNDSHQVNIINLADKKTRKIINLSPSPISALAFDPAAQKIAIKDQSATAIRVYDIEKGILLKRFDLFNAMADDPYSPSPTLFYWGQGKMLASNSDLNLWACALDANTGAGQFPFFWMSPFAMFRNGLTMLAIADMTGALNILKVNDPRYYILKPFNGNTFILSGAFAHNDKIFGIGGSQGQIALFNEDLTFLGYGVLTQPLGIMQIAFVKTNSNPNEFITLTAAYTLFLWKLKTNDQQ